MADSTPLIIKNRTIVADDWTVLRLNAGDTVDNVDVGHGKVIVPLMVWQAQQAKLRRRSGRGIWLTLVSELVFCGDQVPDFQLDRIRSDDPPPPCSMRRSIASLRVGA